MGQVRTDWTARLPGVGQRAVGAGDDRRVRHELNAELNRWETVKKWELLDHDLSIERGELTPSLKVKRAVVAEQNANILDPSTA